MKFNRIEDKSPSTYVDVFVLLVGNNIAVGQFTVNGHYIPSYLDYELYHESGGAGELSFTSEVIGWAHIDNDIEFVNAEPNTEVDVGWTGL